MINSVNKNSQHGVALVVVMLIIALCVIVASRMSSALIFQVQRTDNLNSNQQAYWYAMGAEAFAKSVLSLSFKGENNKQVTHLGQPWAEGEKAFPVDLGEISGEITDLQSCFNVNALVNPEQSRDDLPIDSDEQDAPQDDNAQPAADETDEDADNESGKEIKNKAKQSFIELLTLLEIEGVDRYTAESMADALQDWLDDDAVLVSPNGAEDSDYAAKQYPYLAANSLMTSVNELRLVEHFSAAAILAMQDYVCAIPNSYLHQININTIDQSRIKLLQALLGGIDEGKAQDILAERPEQGFKDLTDFYNNSALKGINNVQQWRQQFVVDSDYFMLTTKTSFNDSYFSMKSIMKINKDESIHVIDRIIGAN